VTKKSTEMGVASSPTWDTLEAFARQSMPDLITDFVTRPHQDGGDPRVSGRLDL